MSHYYLLQQKYAVYATLLTITEQTQPIPMHVTWSVCPYVCHVFWVLFLISFQAS